MKKRFKYAPFYLTLAFSLLFAGRTLAADDWSLVYRQAQAAYPGAAALKEALSRAEDAGAPAEEVSAVLARSKAASVSAQDFGAFIGRLTAARSEGIPSHPFAEKVLEGLAKDVPPNLILSALERQMNTYREAKRIVGEASKGGSGAAALDSVALAMQRGVSPEALSGLFRAVSPGAEVMFHSAQAMADLKDLGFTESQERRMVEAAVKAGYFTHGEPMFTAVVSGAQKSGLSNDEIADQLEADLRRGYPLSRIFRRSGGGLSPAREGNAGMSPDAGGGLRHGPAGGPPSRGRMGGGRR